MLWRFEKQIPYGNDKEKYRSKMQIPPLCYGMTNGLEEVAFSEREAAAIFVAGGAAEVVGARGGYFL